MKIAIVGIGKMGTWLTHSLKGGNEVGIYDIDEDRTRDTKGVTVFSSPSEIESFEPDLLVNCVDLNITIRTFKEILPYVPEKCVLSDMASIKGDLAEYYLNCGHKFVSTHPMFGPTLANMRHLEGESAIIIKESEDMAKKIFKEFYEKIGLNLFEFSFVEHDSMMAYSLTLPFSSSMVFAACVDSRVVPGTNFRKHKELATSLLSEDNDLLSEVLFNPKSILQLDKITSRLEFLKHIIRDRDYEEAGKFFDKLRQNLG